MKYTLVFFTILFLGVIVYLRIPQRKEQKTEPVQNLTGLAAQTNSDGTVTVQITPRTVNEDRWVFDVVLDTHSDELNQDLTQIVIVIDDDGNVYPPIAWEGSPLGGHHREGSLTFSSISQKPKDITLVVKNIGGVAARTFLWELGGE